MIYSCPVCQDGTVVLAAFNWQDGRPFLVCDDCGALWHNAVASSCDTYLEDFASRHGVRASWEDLVILSEDYASGGKGSLSVHIPDSDPDADIKRRVNDGHRDPGTAGLTSGVPAEPCFKTKCPMCGKVTIFDVVVVLRGWPDETIVGVMCEICGYHAKTSDPQERTRLKLACAISQELTSGAIDEATAAERLESLQSSLVAQIEEEAGTWVCPKCGEESPNNFGECWNCRLEKASSARK